MLPFNFHHLYYFYCVAKYGTVSKAAAAVRVSQPALSAQIKQFEGFLGEKLLERDGRGVKLTEEGLTAYAYAQTIFDTGREFIDNVRDRSQKGRLRVQIGVTGSIPKAFASAALKFALKESPSAHILLREDTLGAMVGDLKNHTLDIVLSDRPFQAATDDRIDNRLIGRVPIVFCATAALASKYRRFPADLDGAPLILPTAHSGVYHAVLEYLAQHRVTPNVVAEIQDVELMHRMALEGVGIAPLNIFSAREPLWNRKLTLIRSARHHDIHDSVYLITRKRKKQNPLVEKLLTGFRIAV